MLASILTASVYGLTGQTVEVEVDIASGQQKFTIVGLPDIAVQESRERVRAALLNSGAKFPADRLTVSLAPADIPKSGPCYDLPIAVGILCASRQLKPVGDHVMMFGELGLNGAVRPVKGALPMANTAHKKGVKEIYIPSSNLAEARLVKGLTIFGIDSLQQLVAHLKNEQSIKPTVGGMTFSDSTAVTSGENLRRIRGQVKIKRALEIAAAGGHNMLMTGPPGTGKTLLASCLPSILPSLTYEERLEVTTIQSVAGTLRDEESLVLERPFRAPHYTISAVGLIGGGTYPKPGEVTISHRGVLFMDEMPEFGRSTLEVLRQPLEDKKVTLSRASGTITYPANIMLVGAMNPCPCGYFEEQGENECKCPMTAIQNYSRRVSGPLLDRFDVFVKVRQVKYAELSAPASGEDSSEVRARVQEAREVQKKRLAGTAILTNADFGVREIDKYCAIDGKADEALRKAVERLKLSARAVHRVLKVARTVADLAKSESITETHIGEATQLRSRHE